MHSFSDYNPAALTVWFICVIGTAMFSGHPLINLISLISAVAVCLILSEGNHGGSHGFFFIMFIVLALINPLVSHNGKTVLFVLNDNPVTLEAFLYGINSSAMITGMLYWFRSFSAVMTSEKLLYITGILAPKLSLVLSMALRYIPLMKKQMKKISDSQKAMGLFREDNIFDEIKGRLRIFSILITWALENGIVTADSMEARGYGAGRRTQMKRFKFRTRDVLLMIISIILASVFMFSSASNALSFSFYPAVSFSVPNKTGTAGIVSFGILTIIPAVIETEVYFRWKYLVSKI